MSISTSNPDLFRAILAMDAYNRGYNAGIRSPNAPANEGLTGTQIGLATVGLRKGDLEAQTASFFAQAYSFGTGAERELRWSENYGDMISIAETLLVSLANLPAFTRTGTGFAGAKADPVPEMLLRRIRWRKRGWSGQARP